MPPRDGLVASIEPAPIGKRESSPADVPGNQPGERAGESARRTGRGISPANAPGNQPGGRAMKQNTRDSCERESSSAKAGYGIGPSAFTAASPSTR